MQALIASTWFTFVFTWFTPAVLFVVAVTACIAYYRPLSDVRRTRIYTSLAIGVVVFRLFAAGLKTGLQYYTWTLTDVSKFMLPPHQSIGVLLQYVWTHFWLNAVIAIGAALLFYIVLRLLRSHNERYFEEGEVELGFLMALVVGWPYFVFFVPSVFLLVIFLSIIRGVFLHKPYTTLGVPFFLGAVIAYGVTSFIMDAYGLVQFSI